MRLNNEWISSPGHVVGWSIKSSFDFPAIRDFETNLFDPSKLKVLELRVWIAQEDFLTSLDIFGESPLVLI